MTNMDQGFLLMGTYRFLKAGYRPYLAVTYALLLLPIVAESEKLTAFSFP
jgi:hypothetical protein